MQPCHYFLYFRKLKPNEFVDVDHTAPIEAHGMLRVIFHRIAVGGCIAEVVQKLTGSVPEADRRMVKTGVRRMLESQGEKKGPC